MSPRTKRKKLWVDAKIQGALARRIVFHWFAFFVIALTFSMAFKFLSDPFVPVREYWGSIWKSHGPLVLTMILVLPAFIYDSVKLSNRFVGPILRFRNSIRDLSRGKKVEPVVFRGDDFWLELADEFNAMVERVQENESFRASNATTQVREAQDSAS